MFDKEDRIATLKMEVKSLTWRTKILREDLDRESRALANLREDFAAMLAVFKLEIKPERSIVYK